MCMECVVKEKNKTKVCNICSCEKPINEFNKKGRGYFSSSCKVCYWIKMNNKKITDINGWDINDFKILIDNLLNNKISFINELVYLLNRDIVDICNIITKILKLHIKLTTIIICKNCGKVFNATPFDILSGMQCCSKRCASENKKGIDFQKIIGKGNCLCCNKEFDIKSNVPQQKFCSNPCKSKYYNNNDINKIKVYCDVCKTEVLRTKSNLNKNEHVFCSKTCEVKFRHDQAYEIRQCEICNKEIECSKLSTQRFCSLACQIEWQQKYPKLGLENKQFTSQLISCHWCGNEYYENQYKVNSEQKNFFCSNKCRREWYSKKFSQSIEWKERSAINATKLLCSGIMSKKETSIQTKINKLLSDMNIKYKNEYNCKYVAIDNAIFVNNKMLFIECMGTYWHCDLRNYTKIQYEMQKNRIRMDKIKHTYIKNTYGIDILYLWETDISKNIELCKELIKQYIQNEGLLLNYHSCNYSIVDKKLTLNKYVIQQYMDWDIDDINKVTDLSVKIKMSRKQEDKWIAFECEYCGKEREELISHYNKHKNHYCSRECSSKGRKILNIKNILK